ncbi:hypothetical protein Tco_0546343 [Tanacetum coccineum]
MSKLLEEVRNIREELSEYINCLSWNRLTFYDNDDNEYTIIYSKLKEITPDLPIEEPDNSLSMGDEHLDTIPSVENLIPIPSEFEGISDDTCDVPECDETSPNFTTFSNPLFDSNDDFNSSDDESLFDEDVSMENFKIYSNLLFDDKEIISPKIDPHYFNVEYNLIESLLNHDILIYSSPKFNYLLEEFSDELAHIDPIPLGIEKADFNLEEEIRLVENLLYDKSSRRPPEELNLEIANTIFESLSPSPIPVEDSDSLMEEINLFIAFDDSMPLGIEDDDNDSEGDICFLEEFLNNDSLPLPEFESFHLDPSSPRPPPEPPDIEISLINETDAPVINNVDELNEDEFFDPGGVEINVEVDNSFTFYLAVSQRIKSICNDEDDSIPLRDIIARYSSFVAITSSPLDLPTEEPEDSLIMGDEHLDTILEKESDELIMSSVENFVPIPSEFEDFSDNESECDMPVCDDFITLSNPLFDLNDNFTSSDDKSLSDEDVPMENFKIYSNPLFDDEEIISTKIDPHSFNAESNLIESLLNRDILIDSSPKFDYLLEELSGELAHIDLIPPGIEKADFDLEEEIRLVENLLYDNSSPRPPKELNLEIADTILESLSPSPIPITDSDSLMEEIDLLLASDDLMPPGIENDDYDSEGDIRFLEELLINDSLPLPENESSNLDHFNDPSSPRPPSEPPDVEIC